MDANERRAFALEVADIVVAKLQPSGHTVRARRPRLTVAQFAFCAQRCPEHIRRKIRGRVIPKSMFDGPPYLLDPKAFSFFGVDIEIAMERLPLITAPEPAPLPSGSDQPSKV